MYEELKNVKNSETSQICSESHSSYPPSDCCDACRTRKRVRQRISELKEKEREIISQMNSNHDPLQKIPIEVLSCIFEYTLGDQKDASLRLCLGRICRYWRQVAWSTPSLWNKFTFTIDGFYDYEVQEFDEDVSPDQIEDFRVCVSRSGSLPFFISVLYREIEKQGTIHSSEVASIVEAIEKPDIVHRISILHIEVPAIYLSYFERMQITNLNLALFNPSLDSLDPNFQFQDRFAARLEKLSLRSNTLPMHLPFPNLTDFEASECSIHYLIQIMRNSPILRSCRYKKIKDGISSAQHPNVMPYLQHLSAQSCRYSNIDPLFDELTLPALRYLRIETERTLNAPGVISFFERSQFRLKTLDICMPRGLTIMDVGQLLAVLPLHPSNFILHNTFQRGPISELFRTVLASSTADRVGFNHVNTFSCNATFTGSDEWDFIPELFGPATHVREKPPMNIDLNVEAGSIQTLWIPEEILGIIRDLQEQGWRWTVTMDDPSLEPAIVTNFVDASAQHHRDHPTTSRSEQPHTVLASERRVSSAFGRWKRLLVGMRRQPEKGVKKSRI